MTARASHDVIMDTDRRPTPSLPLRALMHYACHCYCPPRPFSTLPRGLHLDIRLEGPSNGRRRSSQFDCCSGSSYPDTLDPDRARSCHCRTPKARPLQRVRLHNPSRT